MWKKPLQKKLLEVDYIQISILRCSPWWTIIGPFITHGKNLFSVYKAYIIHWQEVEHDATKKYRKMRMENLIRRVTYFPVCKAYISYWHEVKHNARTKCRKIRMANVTWRVKLLFSRISKISSKLFLIKNHDSMLSHFLSYQTKITMAKSLPKH